MSSANESGQSLTSQSIWLLAAKMIAFALGVLLPLLIVRFLDQYQVGVYRQIFLVSNYAVEVLPLGFSMSAYYFLNREIQERSLAIFNIVAFNLLIGGAAFCVLFFFPEVVSSLFQNDEMIKYAPLIGFVIWLRIMGSFLEIAALANREAKLASVLIVLIQLLYMLIMVSSVVIFGTVEAIIDAAIIHGVIQTLIMVVYLLKRYPGFWNRFDLRFMLMQLKYALPFGLAGLLYASQTEIHNFFVGHNFSTAEFAIYSIGCFQLPLIWVLYESVSSVVIPKMSELQAQGKKREMLELSVNSTQKLGMVYFPMFFFLMIVAYDFITTLFTQTYAESTQIFRVNLLLIPFLGLMVDPIGRAFAEVGRFLLKLRIVLVVFLVTALSIVVRHLNLYEVIFIVVGFIILEKVISVWKCMSLLEFRRSDLHMTKGIGEAFLAAGLSGIPLWFIYLVVHDHLVASYVALGKVILIPLGGEKYVDFFEGLLFLITMFVVYVGFYLFVSRRFGLITESDKNRIISMLRERVYFWRNA